MSALRRYEILLPLRFNDGQSVPDALISDTLKGDERVLDSLSNIRRRLVKGVQIFSPMPAGGS
jgi:hypothetical protein